MNCPVCSHPKVDDIDDGLTMGIDFTKLAQMYNVTSEQLVSHWQHGTDKDVVKEKIVSTSSDIYSILRYKLGHLKKRFNNLVLSSPASGESRELIQLSKAIDDTISVTLKVQKELGITDETRIQELERMMSEIMMVMPRMCDTDQALLEAALGLESVET
ncbi:hypothetical protein KAR91_56845 [Candidatus Pacearchaeota archaeon]|nr:hypothetical protein [Candidatus Pacearchaeota archaeon]